MEVEEYKGILYFSFNKGSPYAAQASLELMIFPAAASHIDLGNRYDHHTWLRVHFYVVIFSDIHI